MSNTDNAIAYISSGRGLLAVDPSSTDQTLAKPCRAIMVGVAGNVAVIGVDGSSGVLPALQPGTMYAFAALAILHTGTTATGITVIF